MKILPISKSNVANDAAKSQLDDGNIGFGNIGNNGNIQQDRLPLNFLIEGDNLAALKLLEKTHRGRIDLIYIDISLIANPLVLDCFAGSGTTGHAVMKLNAEDGGKRKFILVTNNENGICEKVTYERLKRVMEKEGYDARLKYFKVGYVPIAGKLYYEYADTHLKHVRELVELENAVDISHDRTVEIVLMGAEEREALESRGVEIHRIPQYYYPELED